jgi:hypothetical protein
MDSAIGNVGDDDYSGYVGKMNSLFLDLRLSGFGGVLFTTDAAGLWEAYLASFPESERQGHNCNECRRFIEEFGGLVVIDDNDNSRTSSAVWFPSAVPTDRFGAHDALARIVEKANVTGVFISSKTVWGTPRTGVWQHLSLQPPASIRHDSLAVTDSQAMAAKKHDFETLGRFLHGLMHENLDVAIRLLKSNALYRSEKVLGAAEWLKSVHAKFLATRGRERNNLLWKAVAKAPAGFCHPRSSMIGTLLDDIAIGMDFEAVSRRFAAKMDPTLYQRPQAAPSAGAIAQAEILFEKLKAAGSLRRRYARLEDIKAIWKPAPPKPEVRDGLFGHLKKGAAAARPAMTLPVETMTWDKFSRQVLPTAELIEFQAPALGSYTTMVTAVDMDAPPIIQWDLVGNRDPVSNYVWTKGSTASQYSLMAGHFYPVSAIALNPGSLSGAHIHKGVILIIEGAKEMRAGGGLGLFPENMKAEFHGIRSVIEAFSRSGKLEGFDERSACGYLLSKGGMWNNVVRVWAGGVSNDYKLDRWD